MVRCNEVTQSKGAPARLVQQDILLTVLCLSSKLRSPCKPYRTCAYYSYRTARAHIANTISSCTVYTGPVHCIFHLRMAFKLQAAALLLGLAVVVLPQLSFGQQGWQAVIANLTRPYVHPLGRANASDWTPISTLNYVTYLPGLKDWASVISGCRAAIKRERRHGNFFIRLAFHDAMAVDVKNCMNGNRYNPACQGADSSALLSDEEMVRPENGHDGLSNTTRKIIVKLASFYGISAADALAVCSTVAIEELTGGRIKFFGGDKNFRVGRLDFVPGETPVNEKGLLPAADIGNAAFLQFWLDHNLTVEEGIALMGSHGVLELQGCRTGSAPEAVCDPDKPGACKDLRLFKMNNHYYHEVCTPSITLTKGEPPEHPEVKDLPPPAFQQMVKDTKCHWSSKEQQDLHVAEVNAEREGTASEEEGPEEEPVGWTVAWNNTDCARAATYGAVGACPHQDSSKPNTGEGFYYTVNDAFLGKACAAANPSADEAIIQTHMRKMFNQPYWEQKFKEAWYKVVEYRARWPYINDLTKKPTLINGKECKLFVLDDKCYEATPGAVKLPGGIVNDALMCAGCGVTFNFEGFALQGFGLDPGFKIPPLDKIFN